MELTGPGGQRKLPGKGTDRKDLNEHYRGWGQHLQACPTGGLNLTLLPFKLQLLEYHLIV